MGNACTTSSSAAGVSILRSSSSSSSGSDADRPQRNKTGSPISSSDTGCSSRAKRLRHHERRLSRDSSFSSDGWSGSSPCHSTGAANIGRRRPSIQALPPQKDGTKRFKVSLSKSDMDDMLCRDSAAGDFLDNILTTYVRHRHQQQQQQQHLAGSIAD